MERRESSRLVTRRIPVSAPALVGNEREYVLEALDSTWISSAGRFIEEFEAAFAERCANQHAIAVCNGTAALHTALLAIGIGPGDEVLVPSLTYIASVNAIRYCGATPVFVESEPVTGNLDPSRLGELITARTKAVIVVHLYGHPVDMDPVLSIARERGLAVVEDAAEAHGATYKDRAIGSLGDIATFSFFGNKIVTTGEGGMILTADQELAERARMIRGQGQDPDQRYWFPIVGFNYRMTNLAAAIGLAQTERFDWHVQRRREIAGWYAERLSASTSMHVIDQPRFARSVFWMNSLVLGDEFPLDRDATIAELERRGIETRPFFYPAHTMPPYRTLPQLSLPTAERLARTGLSLPSSATLTREDVDYVCDALEELAVSS
jgi:perosamine synthetase